MKQKTPHSTDHICGVSIAISIIMYAVPAKDRKQLFQHDIGKSYNQFSLSLMLTANQAAQLNFLKKLKDDQKKRSEQGYSLIESCNIPAEQSDH